MSLHLICIVAALVSFGLAAAGVSSRVGLVPLGLLFLTLALTVIP